MCVCVIDAVVIDVVAQNCEETALVKSRGRKGRCTRSQIKDSKEVVVQVEFISDIIVVVVVNVMWMNRRRSGHVGSSGGRKDGKRFHTERIERIKAAAVLFIKDLSGQAQRRCGRRWLGVGFR